MKSAVQIPVRVVLLALIWASWWWVLDLRLSNGVNLAIIVGGVLLSFPLVWFGKMVLERHHTTNDIAWTTTFVHSGLGFVFGVPLVRAVSTYHEWRGSILPVPSGIGLVLVITTGAALLLTVVNLALRGLGAPFFIAISRRLAVDWLYAWTRNPMVLAGLAFLLSLGVWFQSVLFVLWALVVLAPALLTFVKVYEERELELRFGSSYLAYKARTPMLLPRRPMA